MSKHAKWRNLQVSLHCQMAFTVMHSVCRELRFTCNQKMESTAIMLHKTVKNRVNKILRQGTQA